MKRLNLSFILILFFFAAISQTRNLQNEINEQVWKPFINAFNSNDNEAFRAVHSKDVIRVIQDDNKIMGYDEYFQTIPDSIKAKWGNWKRNIELRFTQRIAGNDKGFEVGYYKTSSINIETGEKRTGYGKFHVLLRKENGVWKILMDADAHENTNEKLFQSGKAME
jgi:ketosteroid isomerase-like protein